MHTTATQRQVQSCHVLDGAQLASAKDQAFVQTVLACYAPDSWSVLDSPITSLHLPVESSIFIC